MKITTTTFTASIAAAFLVGALAVPTFAQPRNQNRAQDGWRANAQVENGGGREARRGQGPRAENPDAPRGPRGPRGPQGGPQAGRGPGAGIPGMEAFHSISRPFWTNERLTEGLNLTDSQIAALEESHSLLRTALKETEGSIREAAQALRAELEKDSPDLTATNAALDGVSEAVNAKSRLFVGHVVTVKNILTAEQEATLRSNRPAFGDGQLREGLQALVGIRDEVREILVNGGSIEDVNELLEERNIPAPARERIIKHVGQRRSENQRK